MKETKLTPREWALDSYVPHQSVISLTGPTSHGKSFLALSWGLHMALGRSWFGASVSFPQYVIYIDAVGVREQRPRLTALDRILGLTQEERLNQGKRFFFLNPPHYENTERKVQECIEEIKKQIPENAPLGIILDYVGLFASPLFLHDPLQRQEIFVLLHRLQTETNASFLFLLESMMEPEREGYQALYEESDIVYHLEKSDANLAYDVPLLLTTKKSNRADVPVSTSLYLKQVPVIQDLPQTSCVIEKLNQ